MVVRLLGVALLGAILSGCAGVKVASLSTSDYISVRRGDILSTGHLSTFTRTSLQVVGIDDSTCRRFSAVCRDALDVKNVLGDEQRLSALSELWLQEALSLGIGEALAGPLRREREISAYIESARYAYAYLFLTDRKPSMRALEDRQTQVRDYYNYAVQQTVMGAFDEYREKITQSFDTRGNYNFTLGAWHINGHVEQGFGSDASSLPKELIPAASLTFQGLRNIYRRDGVGAELVAMRASRVLNKNSMELPWSETPFPAITVVMSFEGEILEEVLSTKRVKLIGYDPYHRNKVTFVGTESPLAANFTSAYGLWLARSGFASQALLTLVGRGDVLERPHVYMMQPYDPNRRIVIMLHGLASSPEAWINVANEVLGDEALREHYQIWQVYYPTNMPLIVNHYAIQKAITETLAYVDPAGTAPASKDIVLLGHSMGGILARLMVSSSSNDLLDTLGDRFSLDTGRRAKLREKVGPYAQFVPLPGVSRAVFIATPHRGTPFAENRFARWVAGIVRLPVTLVNRFADVAQLIVDPTSAKPQALNRPLSSIGSLSDQDLFIQMMADLRMTSKVDYHSIIGNDTPSVPLIDSSDGVVPYRSAHLEGAESEKIIKAWHSVQETPEAIMEVRRILHLHLQAHPL